MEKPVSIMAMPHVFLSWKKKEDDDHWVAHDQEGLREVGGEVSHDSLAPYFCWF